jgi:DNA repair protein RAD50
LKQATTGELPPNTRSGQAFIHDPKVAGETEIKAQIKLRFSTATGQPVVIIRSFQLTQRKSTMQFKALDNVLQTKNRNTGDVEAVTYRCADIDRMVPSLMGVTKAILDNVIFVHQEESNWPLADVQTLKKKFDDIFAATKYTKALEELRKLKSKQAQDVKEMKLRLEHLKTQKDHASKLRLTAETHNKQAEVYQAKVNELEATIKQLTDRQSTLNSKINAVADIKEEVMQLQAQHEMLVKNNAQLYARLLSSCGEEDLTLSIEELQNWMSELEPNLTSASATITRLKREATSNAQQVAALKDQCSKDLRTHGRLAAEAEAHTRNIRERDRYAREEVACRIGISCPASGSGYLDTLTDDEFALFHQAFQSQLDTVRSRLTDAKTTHRKIDDDLSRSLDKANAELSGAVEGLRMKREAISHNESRIDELNRQLAASSVNAVALEEAKQRQEELEGRLSAVQADSSKITELEGELSRSQQKLAQLTAQGSALRKERDQLSSTVEGASRLRFKLAEAADKEEKIESLLTGRRGRLESMLGLPRGGALPDPHQLKNVIQGIVQRQQAEAQRQEAALKSLQAKEATTEGSLTTTRQQLQRLQQEANQLNQVITRAMLGLSGAVGGAGAASNALLLQQQPPLADVEEEVKNKATELAQLDAFEQISGAITQTAMQSNLCMTCARPFATTTEKEAFLARQRAEAALVPTRKQEVQAAITQMETRLKILRQVQPTAQRHDALTQNEIPNLQRQVTEQEALLKDVKAHLEDTMALWASADGEATEGKKVLQEVAWPVEHLATEARALRVEVDSLRGDVTAASTVRTVANVDADLDSLEHKKAQIEAAKEDAARRLNRHRDQQTHLRAEIAKAREDVMRLSAASERKTALKAQIDEIIALNQAVSNQIAGAADERAILEARRAEVEAERAQRRSEAAAREGELESRLKSLDAAEMQLSSRQRAVEEYVSAGKADQLNQATRRLEELKQRQENAEAQVAALETEYKQIEQEQNESSAIRHQLDEILAYKKSKVEEDIISGQLDSKTASAGSVGDLRILHNELTYVESQLQKQRTDRDKTLGSLTTVAEAATTAITDLSHPQYEGIEEKHGKAMIELMTTQMANSDLEKYHKALERALLSFHTTKMADINTIIKELWQKTYRNSDIDYIAIKADSEGATAARSYNYRVVMRCGDAELDMRGRCSAGQKVLACLIIRLALAETFCLNCGILALDEPTTNLDADNSGALAEALRAIMMTRREQENFQLIVITHDENFARQIGTREHAEYMWRVEKDEHQHSTIIQEVIGE